MNGTTTPLGIPLPLWYHLWIQKLTNSASIVRDLIHVIYKTGMYSEMDTIATTTAMPKKVNADSAKKFRPITLQSEIPKMCCKISLNASKDDLFQHIDQSQGGAQPHLSHQNQLCIILITTKQQSKIGKGTILGAADTEKAFDSILHRDLGTSLWKKCQLKGNIFLIIANSYLTATTFMKICLAGTMIYGKRLEMCNGIFQGNSQSAPLYIIVTDLVIKQFQHKIRNLPKIQAILPSSDKWKKYFNSSDIHNSLLIVIFIILIVFVDDTTVLANDLQTIKKMLLTYFDDSHEHNLHINNDKTKLMIFNKKYLSKRDQLWLKQNKNQMQLKDQLVKFVDEIKLLGFIFNNNDTQFQHNWQYNLEKATSAWNFLVLSNFIQVNNKSMNRNIQIIESKIRPILEHCFSIIPINFKFLKEYDQFINRCYKKIIQTRISSNSTIIRMLIGYQSTFQRNNQRLLGFYYRILNSESKHKSIRLFKQDLALTYDNYDDDLIEVDKPFTINYKKCKTYTSIFVIILDKLGLSKYKYYSEITSIKKKQWKNLVAHQLAKLQYNQDYDKIKTSKNELIKFKFKSWYECDRYYIKESILMCINNLCQQYNIYIWRILTNDLEFNWKIKKKHDAIKYKYPNCIFCKHSWHVSTTPIKHLFEQCTTMHRLVKIHINNTDCQDKIYSKWNLLFISKLGDLIHERTRNSK